MQLELIKLVIILIILPAIYIFLYKTSTIEGMIVQSDNMKQNVYNKHNIILDTDNEVLIKNNKKVNYHNNFNSKEAARLVADKAKTNKILSEYGLPVCNYVTWNNDIGKNENLRIINNKLSFPLVIKYSWGQKGEDVFTNIISNDTIIEKIDYLKNKGKNSIIIEEQCEGNKYRIMILNDKFIYASEDIKPIIIGDGISNIKTLIKDYPKKTNSKPILNINEDLIQQQGYSLNDIPEKNKMITVTNVINISNGAKNKYRHDYEIHPINMNLFYQINKVLGLNFSGIDYMTSDLSIPYFQEGKIIEVNAFPGFSVTTQNNNDATTNFVNALF